MLKIAACYQLGYTGEMVCRAGFEPAGSAVAPRWHRGSMSQTIRPTRKDAQGTNRTSGFASL